ncbi:MAG: O-antigen ligase family protein [Firmicutes bacterium]|nr:O-antigen ligase family protein [Bacillota bacterium]
MYGIIVGALSFLDPAWGVFSIFVVCENYGIALLGPEVSVVRLVVPVVVLAIVARYLLRRRFPRPDQVWILTAVFYVYACVVSLIFGHLNVRMVAFMLSSLIIRALVTHDSVVLKRVLSLYVLATLISAGVGLVKGGYIVGGRSLYRFIGGFTDPNVFAKYLLIALTVVLFSRAIGSRLLRRVLAGTLIVLTIFTYSKMGMLVAGVLILAYLVTRVCSLKSGRTYRSGLVTVGLLIALSVTLVFLTLRSIPLVGNVVERFTVGLSHPLNADQFLDALTTKRWSLWNASVDAFVNSDLASQVFGTGYNASREALQLIVGELKSTHSVFLQVLLDFGLLGCILFIFILLLSLDWRTAHFATFIRTNSLWFTYVATFAALAWIFDWSNLPFFAWVGTQSFREISNLEQGCHDGD